MRTKRTGKILLRDALIDAMLREFDRDMEKCEESPICSPEHYKKMSEIVGFDVTKPRRNPRMSVRKKVIIFIIAAALALTGCAAVFYRQIGNFMEEVYEKYIKVHFVEETPAAPTEIEDVYTLSYVPEGYELINSEINYTWTKFEYKNSLNETIKFEQFLITDTCNIFDSNQGYSEAMQIESTTVYHKNTDNVNIYKWNNGVYAFSIRDRQSLSKFEIIRIISSLKKQ